MVTLVETAFQVLLPVLLLIGIAASAGFFIYKVRDGSSIVDIWKYFIITIIWIVIFLVFYYLLSGAIMQFLAGKFNIT